MERKVCFIVQRYGLEVNGGAELHCRQLAEHLSPFAEVHVLTSKAVDYTTWADVYESDEEDIHGIRVHRFGVSQERDVEKFNKMAENLDTGVVLTNAEEQNWVDEQGPMVPELTAYLKEHKDDYDAFIFFTYLYYPTVMGVREVAEKAIVIPTAHDEPYLRLRIFENVFRKAKAFLYNTEEERRMIHKKFYNHVAKSEIGGVGVDVPTDVNAERFKEKYGLDQYVVYVGRIDIGKNCHELFNDFVAFKNKYPSDLKLVLMGKEEIPVPEREDIVSLGFVNDEDKFDGISGAKALVLPSKYESLSMVVLEAFTQKVPVLVNGFCEVLKAHCMKSDGGFYYNNQQEFIEYLQYMLEHPDISRKMGENGAVYVEQNYQWKVIVDKLRYLIEYVTENGVD
ncbi:MAG: glycosyltransferase [Clostridia bacterium]|nr:glycosyltransferase family 4 protein [Lachnospiraceae bacterium]NCC00365.1 glycosyltransferase [Clostridia bacterium]NCD02749.1 glycosyltransferase [Clostridia bacterium]